MSKDKFYLFRRNSGSAKIRKRNDTKELDFPYIIAGFLSLGTVIAGCSYILLSFLVRSTMAASHN